MKELVRELSKSEEVFRYPPVSKPSIITQGNLHPQYGQYLDYLARHYLLNKRGMPTSDMRTEIVIEQGEAPRWLMYSYDIYCTNPDTLSITRDIWRTSLAHSLFFKERVKHLVDLSVEVHPQIVEHLDVVHQADSKLVLLANPMLSDPSIGIKGDADLIAGKTVIDFKASVKSINTPENICQCLIYSGLYYRSTDVQLKRIYLVNLIGDDYVYDLDTVPDWHEKLNPILVEWKRYV